MSLVAVNPRNGAATHFGRQMRKERLAHGWSLREFSARTGIDFTLASRIENGKRPPAEAVARACDRVFPERRGWFSEFYEESKSWAPPGFRDWAEHEDRARRLSDWWPGILSGLLQTEGYARALLTTYPGVSDEVVSARLAARMSRQQRMLHRDDPPSVCFVVDEMSLYRRVGSAAVMAVQMDALVKVSELPKIRLQVLPAVEHPANAGGVMVADDSAAYVEHLAGGLVFTEGQTVSSLARMFDSLRAECYRASESAALLQRMRETWNRLGARAANQTPTAEPALKSEPTA